MFGRGGVGGVCSGKRFATFSHIHSRTGTGDCIDFGVSVCVWDLFGVCVCGILNDIFV